MASRMYGWEAGTTTITPAVDGGWEASGAPFARKPMHTGGRVADTALTTTAGFTSTTGQDRCHRQWISRPMAEGNAFTTATTFKAYAQVLEAASTGNIKSRLCVRVLSEDGATVRATLLAIADYSTGAEWNTALRNKAFADGDASTANYTTVDGDRLVVEWGHNDTSGTSPSSSSRWGSFNAAQIDLPEDETSTSTVARPWFETSLTIVFKTPTPVHRYLVIDGVNTAGGDGTTDTNSGANRAWVTIPTAMTGLQGRDWPTNNEQVTLHCRGSTADAIAATANTGTIQSAPDCPVRIIGDSPTSLIYSTSYYRIEPVKGQSTLTNNGVLYLRVENMQVKGNPPDAGGYATLNYFNLATLEPGDCRFINCCTNGVTNNVAAGGIHGMWSGTAAPNVLVTGINCVVFNIKTTGGSCDGFAKASSCTVNVAFENCTSYNNGTGYLSGGTNDLLCKNCGSVNNTTDGYTGTFAAASTNNASDIAADAPGSNARNSVTPTFVNAGTDFHLVKTDTAWKGFAADLSADARLPFVTDGDGQLRLAPWSIGADDPDSLGSGFVALQAVQTAANW